MAKKDPLKCLTVAFRNERIPTKTIELQRSKIAGPDSFETDGEVRVPLPGGGEIHLHAEVNLGGSTPDVSISVLEGEDITCAVRCTSGVVIGYETRSGIEVLLQVGTGPWE
jgi:hypothetical protein